MKMSILEIEYKNIRKISELKLTFDKKNNFIITYPPARVTVTSPRKNGSFLG